MPIDTSQFIIDETPYRESSGINQLNDNRNRQEAIAYRNQKEKEADQLKKLNLIQDLTDLSKHQTGNDVANAVGNQHANEIFKKYTASAGSMSPAELQYNISKDMNNVIGGLDGMKNELATGDQQLTELKTKHPDLDISSLAKLQRADILHRRLNDKNEFNNPLEVAPPEFDLNNPELLAKFTNTTKDLDKFISTAQGSDEPTNVYTGSPENYRKYTGKVPFWKVPAFKEEDVSGDFLKKGTPSLKIKGSTIPAETLPSSNGKPFNIVDKDVYDQFSGDENKNRQLTKATMDAFPQYDTFNEQEKEYAKRNILYKKIETLDKNDFHLTDIKTPSAAMLKFYAGGSGGGKGATEIRDVYNQVNSAITNKGEELPFGLGKGVKLNDLDATSQRLILEYANKLVGTGMTQSDVALVKSSDGTVNMVDPNDGKVIAPIDFGDINVGAQPGIKEKRKVIEAINKTYEHGGKKYTHSQIEKAAQQSDMSVEDYLKATGIK